MNAKWQPPYFPYEPPRWTPPPYVQPLPPATPYDGGPTIDATPTSVEVHQPPAPTTVTAYSRIILADFVRHKFFSTTQPGIPPDVSKMQVEWDRFHGPDDHTVRLFIALSRNERAHLNEHGYNDDVLGEEPILDDAILAEVRESQDAEIAQAPDSATESALRMEHREQLDAAKNEKIEITPDHLLRFPFERTFERRIEATRYKAMVERVYLPKLRKMLSEKGD